MNRRTAWSALALALVCALFIGSGDSGSGDDGAIEQTADATADRAHCDAIQGLSVCVEYASQPEAEADCVSFDGAVHGGACPSEGLSGSCEHDGKTRKYYQTGGSPNDPDYAERHCKNAMAGSFTAAP